MTDREFALIEEAFSRLATVRREMLDGLETLRELLVETTSEVSEVDGNEEPDGVSQKALPAGAGEGEAKAAKSDQAEPSH